MTNSDTFFQIRKNEAETTREDRTAGNLYLSSGCQSLVVITTQNEWQHTLHDADNTTGRDQVVEHHLLEAREGTLELIGLWKAVLQ